MLPRGEHHDDPVPAPHDRRRAHGRGRGRHFLEVDPAVLSLLTAEAMRDIAHFLRPGHLAQLRAILDDPEASPNDRFVALELLKNASIAAGGVLPSCQDTGTAIVMGKKGQHVLTGGGDEAAIARGVFDTYQTSNLRYSQMAPLDMYHEVNTGNNLPAQIEIYATDGRRVQVPLHGEGRRLGEQELPVPRDEGAAQPGEPHAVPRREAAHARHGGVPAVPPRDRHRRHVSRVHAQGREVRVGALPRRAADRGQRARRGFRDIELEQQVLELTRQFGIGAQFGGKYFCHDVRVVRLPRHGASCPVAIAVSCSADRQALGKITARRRLPRGARARPGEVPARGHRGRSRRRRRAHRPQPADGRDPRHALEVPGEDAARADRADGRRPRHRPRQDQGAARRRRARCRSTCATTASTTQARRRRPRATRRARSGRRPPAAWTPTSTSSSRTAAAS